MGIDVVEIRKARHFYNTHQNRLKTFFDPSEVRLIQKSQKPYESVAMLLAAKEAVFKASSEPWMGVSGFRNIQIVSKAQDRLSFRLKGRFKRSFSRNPLPQLSILKKDGMVIVKCHSSASEPRTRNF